MAADRLRGRRDGASVEMDSAPMVGCKTSATQIGRSNHSDIENEPGVILQKSPGKVLGGAGRLSMTISPVLLSARADKRTGEIVMDNLPAPPNTLPGDFCKMTPGSFSMSEWFDLPILVTKRRHRRRPANRRAGL